MKRRDALKKVAASGLSVSIIGTASATASDQSKSGSGEDVEVNNLSGSELERVKKDVRSDSGVQLLIEEVKPEGWKPVWTSIQAVTRSVDQESISGSFDTAVVEFQAESREKKSTEEMYLQWVGNSDLNLAEFLDEDPTGSTILHLKDDPDSNLETNLLNGPIADEVTVYEAINGTIESATESPSDTEKFSGQGDVSTQSTGTCDLDVDVYDESDDPSSPCWNKTCLLLNGLTLGTTALGCIATGGLLCLAGGGIFLASYASCIACPKAYSNTITVDKSYFDDWEGDPCDLYAPDNGDALVVTRCELADMPTEEETNPGNC